MTIVWSAVNVTHLRIYTSVCSTLSALGLIYTMRRVSFATYPALFTRVQIRHPLNHPQYLSPANQSCSSFAPPTAAMAAPRRCPPVRQRQNNLPPLIGQPSCGMIYSDHHCR